MYADYFSLPMMVAAYMFFQYLAVPLVNLCLGKGDFSEALVLGVLGIFAFILGSRLPNLLGSRVAPHAGDQPFLTSKDVRVLYYSSLVFIAIGVLIKIKSCFFFGGLGCNDFFYRVTRPNLLYLSSAIALSAAILLSLRLKMELRKLITLFLLVFLFTIFVAYSGVGRTLVMGFYCSLFLGVLLVFPQFRKIRYVFMGILLLILCWILISYIKEMYWIGSGEGRGFNAYFLYTKIINRISQAHIVENIIKHWPADIKLYAFGWQDFFTLPAISIERNYLNGNDFGHAVKIIADDDFVTGIAPTFIGDLYMRGGAFYGVFLGMFFVGILCRQFDFLLYSLPRVVALFIYMNMVPIILHGTEDFVFLTLSTNILMLAFFLTILMCVYLLIEKKSISNSSINAF